MKQYILQRKSIVGLCCLLMAAIVGCAQLGSGSKMSASIEAAMQKRIIDLSMTRPGDQRQKRSITLDNKLEVLLISDPNTKRSAAAMDIAVGSLEDPEENLGMAHFLEHMLFLGTEKYPTEGEYSQYLSKNSGSSNAYTAAERTNYHFQVNHDAFEGALDRFAQFFIAPLFTPEFVDREMNAVHSEHQKNLQSDGWRAMQVKRATHREGHARTKFSTGDLSTLKSTTREQLIAFYKKYYSANVMKLCLLSSHDLDAQEKWVREKFAAVKNINREALSYSQEAYDSKLMPQEIKIIPVSNMRSLELTFAIKPTRHQYRSKPASVVAGLLGYEGAGSLLSELKKQNLATGLGAGLQEESYATYIRANIQLTDKGRQNIDDVVSLAFSYFASLRKAEFPAQYFIDQRNVADLNFFFRDHTEGTDAVSAYAQLMQLYPAANIEEFASLYYEYDPAAVANVLDQLRPDKVRLALQAPDVKTTKVEPYYQVNYDIQTVDSARVKKWEAAQANPAFFFPPANPFIPDSLGLTKDGVADPVLLVDNSQGKFWFQQDHEFDLPKAQISLLFVTDKFASDPKQWLLAQLFALSLTESLNEWNYFVQEAGSSTAVGADPRGIRIVASGYSQRILSLLESLAMEFRNIKLTDEGFESIKSDFMRALANQEYSQAYTQALYEFRSLLNAPFVHKDDFKDLVADIRLADVKEFAKTVIAESKYEGVGYGSISGKDLKKTLDKVFNQICSSELPADRWVEPTTAEFKNGRQSRVMTSLSNNNCWLSLVSFGANTVENEAIARVAAIQFKTGFYSEMRTRQQLGYIVHSGPSVQPQRAGMLFLIQSGTHTAADVAKRAETYITQAVNDLPQLKAEVFEGIKASIALELSQKEKNISEKLDKLGSRGLRYKGQFDRNERVKEALKNLTLNRFIAALKDAFNEEKRQSMTVYLDKNGSERTKPTEQEVMDRVKFRKEANFQ